MSELSSPGFGFESHPHQAHVVLIVFDSTLEQVGLPNQSLVLNLLKRSWLSKIMATTLSNANNAINVSLRISTRQSPGAATASSGSITQPILITGSVPSEVTHLFRTKRVSEIRQFE